MTSYAEFLASKAQLANSGGFDPTNLPDHLFDYQADLVTWAVRHGRSGIFADCGLGKSPMALAWADQVHRHTGKPVLFLTPLAVGFQIATEANKFGHDAALSRNGQPVADITITNYEQLPKFHAADFGGVVCDESSILKSFDGATKATVTEFMRLIQYRLLCTATAAPNDYTELGTSSEALGGLGYMDMLTRFFVNDNRSVSSRGRTAGGKSIEWRMKGHAEEPFWKWVASADELLVFRKPGESVPVAHPFGLTNGYAGSEPIPVDLLRFRGMDGDQKTNRYSHHIWRRYASSVWDDIRLDRVLPFRDAKDEDDEKHVHPLQLDVIERYLDLCTMPGEKVLTPFMGVGSEVYAAVQMGRFPVGAELKPSYFRQALQNLAAVDSDRQKVDEAHLFQVDDRHH